jgi:nickel/cobalt exporter
MAWRTRRDIKAESSHGHGDGHSHEDHGEKYWIQTGHGSVQLEIFEKDVPPIFRLRFYNQGVPTKLPEAQTVSLDTQRLDGTLQTFAVRQKEEYLESTTPIPEPHEFIATLRLSHGDHVDSYVVTVAESHTQSHGADGGQYQDAHELAHATEIERRFADRPVTNAQIALFGLTGGLLPCPAAFTIVLVCLQLKKFTLGIFMVFSFSIGLALTLVATGALAAWSLRHAEKRFSGFGKIVRKLPYLSSALLMAMALYIGFQGWLHLTSIKH